jgi:hypothetical protein
MMSASRLVLTAGLLGTMVAACGPKQNGEATDSVGTDNRATEPSAGSISEPGPVTSGECIGEPATSTSGTGSSGPVDDTTDGTPDLCPGHPGIDACCCFEDALNGLEFPYAKVVCGIHRICQDIWFESDNACFGDDVISTSCPDAIDCALAALIADTPGTISWSTSQFEFSRGVAVHIVGDGTAFTTGVYRCDLAEEIEPVVRRTLASKAYFTECASRPSAIDRFECVKAPFVGAAIETCVGP